MSDLYDTFMAGVKQPAEPEPSEDGLYCTAECAGLRATLDLRVETDERELAETRKAWHTEVMALNEAIDHLRSGA